MVLEEQRFIHEDLERLEQAVADRVTDEPRNIRERLARDHEISQFLDRIEEQSKRLLDIYKEDEAREKEIQAISTGDQFEEFYKQLDEIKDFHKRYPNEPVENLERAYKRRQPGEGEPVGMEIDNMFSGEEGFGQFLDLTMHHEDYLNLPGVKRISYVQYLDVFDAFTSPHLSIKRANKISDKYFGYVGELSGYLESFIKKVRPLQDLDKLFASFDEGFEKQWAANEVPGWTEEKPENGTQGPKTEGSGEGIWCPDCEKEFKNENVYKNHLTGKKHIRAAEARKAAGGSEEGSAAASKGATSASHRLKERAVAEREHRVRSLAGFLDKERQATRINVERKQGMTERERQMELDALLAEPESLGGEGREEDESDGEGEDRVYNPLKLPLAWDGKPIPYWLYKLHGLGVEYPCEICGNFVYMGRRAFDKHFSEALHIFGLKCLGITSNTNLFREITRIEDAIKLWEKLEQEKKRERESRDNVVQMEDAEGNVMPERIYLEKFPILLEGGTMGFKFAFLCDLLSSLEDNQVIKASTAARNDNPDIRAVSRWFVQHEKRLRHKETDQVAVLSCMFPEKLSDRVYWLQHTSLVHIIGRCLLLGISRREELERWRLSGGIDLGECVENVMRQAENYIPSGQEVSVEEIDAALVLLASRCKFSGPRARRQHTAVDVEECLGPLYRRMSSRDAKWLTRMILKNYSPVMLPTNFILKKFHFLLPPLLLFQDSFGSALETLASDRISCFPPHPEPGLARDLGAIAMECLNPKIGVKIGRLDYYKARGIKHCCQMVDRRRMSIERKYDGEYCQIHIDLSKHPNSIQIFSKSGKDSTMDKSGIHKALRQALRIGSPKCQFSKHCILEGELLVYSDKHGKIMDFNKLRKFIPRSGTFIGTENDSLPQPYEHLMVIFFDVLVLDDDICLKKPHRERRLLLKRVIEPIDGRAGISEQQVLDFSQPDSPCRLERIFAKAIAQRWEGCVLKGCDDPYFSMFQNGANSANGRWIKLKKDYIPGLGDTADLAIIGAKYIPHDANALKQIPNLLWTHFFIGCLVNKEAILHLGATPRFQVIDVINRHCASLRNMQILNQFGEFHACDLLLFDHGFNIEYGKSNIPHMDVIFKTPFVVEMLGSGFEKPSGARYFALRFPRIVKIHWDRTFEDAVSFQELQDLADKARAVTAEDDSEQQQWSKRLKLSNGNSQYVAPAEQSFTSTATSEPETECYTASGSQDVTCAVITELDKKSGIVPTDPIPIHIDATAKPRSPSSESDRNRNLLTENVKQSTYPKPRAHTLAAQQAGFSFRGNAGMKGLNNKTPVDNSATRFAQTKSNEPYVGSTGYPSAASTTPTTVANRDIRLGSSIINLPQYLCVHPSPDDNRNPFSNVTCQTENFLQGLKMRYCNSSCRSLALGLVFLDPNTSLLGPELLNIINSLSECLNKNHEQRHNFPPSGKIFFLASNIRNLGDGLEDPRFCLRATWDNISEANFYACVSWATAATPCSIGTSQGLFNGIPSTSSLGHNAAVAATATPTPKQSTVSRTSISVSFREEELAFLGELVSIEP